MNRILINITFLLLPFLVISQEKNIFDIARKGTLQEIENAYKELLVESRGPEYFVTRVERFYQKEKDRK